MRKYVLCLAAVLTRCATPTEGTGEIGESGATGTPFDMGVGPSSPTPESSTGEIPDIPTTGGGPGGDGDGDSSGDAAPVCGDGVVEGSEGCDDGFVANQNPNPCTADCTVARCGDGYVQSSNGETCDEGPLNAATPGYDECSTSCVRESYCGDGVVQVEAGEECEGGGEGEVENCGSMCRLSPRLVFLTSAAYSGAMGGLAGADQRCNEFAAQQPALTGTYRAWLMVAGQSLADRFPEFAAPVAWSFTNTSAGLLAKSFAELVAEGPAEPVAFTESGEAVPQQLVWTAISKDGLAPGGDCAQWTSELGSPALVGYTGYVPNVGPEALQWQVERLWTDWGEKEVCNKKLPIYCVQVAD